MSQRDQLLTTLTHLEVYLPAVSEAEQQTCGNTSLLLQSFFDPEGMKILLFFKIVIELKKVKIICTQNSARYTVMHNKYK